MKILNRKSKGFTLIELMVVMTILSVLAGIVVPAVTGTTTIGRGTALTSDIVTVQQAVDRFAGENPAGTDKGWPTAGGTLPAITAVTNANVPIDWGASFADSKDLTTTGEKKTKVFLIHYLRGSVSHSGATRGAKPTNGVDITTIISPLKPADVIATTHGTLTDGNVTVTLNALDGTPTRVSSNSLWPADVTSDNSGIAVDDVVGDKAYPVWRVDKYGKVLVVMSDNEY